MPRERKNRKIKSYFSPDRNASDVIIGFIDRCEEYIDVAVYSITRDEIASALIRAHNRGVRVRVLTDKVQASGRYADDERMEMAGIEVRRDTQSGSFHHKFMIGDGLALKTGSYNWTKNAEERNAENFVLIKYKYVIEEYQEEYDRLWELNAPK